jgi:hypothetical protein
MDTTTKKKPTHTSLFFLSATMAVLGFISRTAVATTKPSLILLVVVLRSLTPDASACVSVPAVAMDPSASSSNSPTTGERRATDTDAIASVPRARSAVALPEVMTGIWTGNYLLGSPSIKGMNATASD